MVITGHRGQIAKGLSNKEMKLTKAAMAGRRGLCSLSPVLDRPSTARVIPVMLLVSCTGGVGGPVATVTIEHQSPAIRDSRLVEPVGFETLGGVLTPVLTACATPCEKTEVFSTATDNQSQISLFLVRGGSGVAAEGHRLGTFLIKSIPPRPRGTPQIAVTLRADAGDLILLVRDRGGATLTLNRAPH